VTVGIGEGGEVRPTMQFFPGEPDGSVQADCAALRNVNPDWVKSLQILRGNLCACAK